MPELFDVDEKHGCNSTIKLDNGEHCLVSVAQSGVIVRSHRTDSFLKAAFGSFFGPILFEEKSPYEAAKLAMLLDIEYADITCLPEFKNPVLCAFVKAIWSCASAEQVCVVLNETSSKARKIDAIEVAMLLWANQRYKTRKPAKKLRTAGYDVVYSDGKTQILDITQDEIQSWAEGSNNMFEKHGLPYRILRIVGKDGTVVWPPT